MAKLHRQGCRVANATLTTYCDVRSKEEPPHSYEIVAYHAAVGLAQKVFRRGFAHGSVVDNKRAASIRVAVGGVSSANV